ncbi:MAG: hypothetical protein IT581_20775 [Verrucomicrobiales bacterium]|nr:hypothetical protein [Verrucomicrobiales bacterium]
MSGGLGLAASSCGTRRPGGPRPLSRSETSSDAALLRDIIEGCWRFFDEAAHPVSGQVLDRRRTDGGHESRRVASIAATGFGLTGLCIADRRRLLRAGEGLARARRTLGFIDRQLPNVRGFYYHFHDWETGERIWKCELSSVDTTWLLAGVLCCQAHFEDREVDRLATRIFERVEWPWMLAGGKTLSMGWFPEKGFLASRWDHYCELMVLYLLGLGSRSFPLPADTWLAWDRPVRELYGERYVWSPAPLFVHQFAQAWVDFRNWEDHGVNWHENSVRATRAHRAWSVDQRSRFSQWSGDLWGVTSSDSAQGYVGWGGPPDSGPLDGTIVPCAAAGSLPFLPEECLRTLRYQRERFGDKIWSRYGFVDAFNPHTGWVNPDVVGIDVGVTMLMAENLATGSVWKNVVGIPEVRRGQERALSVSPKSTKEN